MTSALDTQEVATSQSPEIAQVTTVIEKTLPEQNQVEDNPSKKIKIYVPVSTIDLTHSEEEEDIISPVPFTVETGNEFQNFTNGSNGNPSSSLPQSQPFCHSAPSSSAILLSSVMDLSSFSDGSIVTPFMTELYQNATHLPESITPIPMVKPIPLAVVTPIFKIPLHIPSIRSVSSPMSEKIAIVSPSSFLKATTMKIPYAEASVHEIPSAPEVTLAQNVTSSLATSHITMAIPFQATTQTSSLISTGISIPPIDEVRDDFNEDFVVSLGEYRYRKAVKYMVR